MKSEWKHLIVSSLLCLATVGIFLLFGKNLPDPVPTHWDFSGNVNGTMPKNVLTFGAPLVYLILNGIVYAKFQNNEKGAWKYYLTPLVVIALSFLIIFLALR